MLQRDWINLKPTELLHRREEKRSLEENTDVCEERAGQQCILLS